MDEQALVKQYRDRIRKRVLSSAALAAAVFFLAILDVQIGSSSIPLQELIQTILRGPNDASSASFIVWDIRLPMTFTCLFVGASLSLAGLLIQTITNNPLASPYTCHGGGKFRRRYCDNAGICRIRSDLDRRFSFCARYGAFRFGFYFLLRKPSFADRDHIDFSGRDHELFLPGASAVSPVSRFSGDRPDYFRVDLRQPSEVFLD